MCFSYSTPREISRGLKRIWDSKMRTPSSVRIIEDVYLVLKALEIVYRANGAEVELLSDRNEIRKKEVGEGKSVSCGGAQPKVRVASVNSSKRYSFTVICFSCV